MGYAIKQIGYVDGDKILKGVIPNMRVRELRYYPQHNPNLYRTQSRELSPKTVVRIFKSIFNRSYRKTRFPQIYNRLLA